MIPVAAEKLAIAEFSQSELVDFPIWVLMQCGLKITPFDLHDDGFECFRTLAMDTSSWQRWFRRLVASQHTGFLLHRDGAASLIAKREAALNSVPFVYNGITGFESSLEQQSEDILGRYYDVVERMSTKSHAVSLLDSVEEPILSGRNPIDFWDGSESVKASLSDLWVRYCSRPYYRVHHASDLHRLLVRNGQVSNAINIELSKILKGQEKFLMFHFVNYRKDVFTVVDESLVIGLEIDRPFSIEALKNQMFKATRAFVEMGNGQITPDCR